MDFVHCEDMRSDGTNLGKKRRNSVKGAKTKAKETCEQKQKRGIYRNEETSIVFDSSIRSTENGTNIHSLLESKMNDGIRTFTHPFNIEGLVLWTYRNYLQGGQGNVTDDNVNILPTVVVLYSAEKFIRLSVTSDMNFHLLDDDIALLRSQIACWTRCNDFKLIFAVLKLDESIISYQRQVWKTVPSDQCKPIAPKIDESIVHLSFTHNVELMDFKLVTDVAEYLWTISRALINEPYLQPKSEIGHVSKRSIKRPPEMTDAEFEEFELKEIWIRMLQVIPGVSEPKARLITQHYACPSQLLPHLTNDDVPLKQREALLADKMDSKRRHPKSSKTICTLMNSTDGSALLKEE